MQLESETREVVGWWVSACLALIPYALVGAAATGVFGLGIVGFVAVVVALLLLDLLGFALRSIASWGLWAVRGRRRQSAEILEFLKQNRFPRPHDSHFTAQDYFESVAADESVSVETRLLAAREFGAFEVASSHLSLIFEVAQRALSFMNAIEKYRRSFST